MVTFARYLMIAGAVMFVIGGLLYAGGRLGLPLGRLPGDIRITGQNFTCIFSLAASILLSIILTVAINIAARLLNR